MASKQRFEAVSLDQIDTEDHYYKVSTGDPTGSLVASIQHAGVLNPPVLYTSPDKALIIISGFKRIAVLKQLGQKEATVRILKGDTDLEQRIEIAIADNAFQRELNSVEQGRAILLLDRLYADAEELCKKAGRLGVPANPKSAQKLRMAAQLDPNLKTALLNGDIALPVAIQLSEMEDRHSADQLTRIFSVMGLGLNRQREMLDWLKGISMRERISLRALIEDVQVQGLLNESKHDHKLKSRMLRDYFKQRRYPEITEAELRFQEIVKSFKLGKGIQITPPQHFEGQSFNLEIRFSSHKELVSKYRDLEKTIQSPGMASLWELFTVK